MRIDACSAIDVASRRPVEAHVVPESKRGEVYLGFGDALARSSAELVYVSTENSAHADLVMAALDAGKHVVVDKPSMLDCEQVARGLELAERRGLCLAEALVYPFHPQVAALRELFAQFQCVPTRVIATLSIPPLPPTSFRYRKTLGGGALWDLGPYAVSLGRVIFSDSPLHVHAQVNGVHASESVDISFSTMESYAEGRAVVGQFGFDTEYENSLVVLGEKTVARISRFFTTAPDAEAEIMYRAGNAAAVVRVPAADSFEVFLREVTHSIDRREWARFSQIMLHDAKALHALRVRAAEP